MIELRKRRRWGPKLYLNGHEWLKRQLTKEGIGFESFGHCGESANWVSENGQTIARGRLNVGE
jgi:hypothetical protein